MYKAALGLVDEERGLSLRFPRFYKIREDKVNSLARPFDRLLLTTFVSQGIEDALHPDEFAGFYRRQEAGPKKADAGPGGEAGDVEVEGEVQDWVPDEMEDA